MGKMSVNKLKLNPNGIKILWISKKADQGLQISPVLGGVLPTLKSQVCHLGVLLDTAVTIQNQVVEVIWNTFVQLHLVYQLHPFLA